MRLIRALSLAVVLFGASTPVGAEDFVCTSPGGCEARITRGGKLTSTTFRKGDMVSTEAGWVVSTEDGWKKVKTRDDGTKEAPPPPQHHPWWWPIPCAWAGCHFTVAPFPLGGVHSLVGPLGPIPHQIALIGR